MTVAIVKVATMVKINYIYVLFVSRPFGIE